MTTKEEIELLRKHLKNELSEAELSRFTDIFCSEIREENLNAAIDMEMEFLLTKTDENPEARLKGYSKLLQHINSKNRIRGSLRFKKKVIGAVLVIFIMSCGALLFWPYQDQWKAEKQKEIVKTSVRWKKYLQLTDKSEIWLNNKSSIHWDKLEFNKKYREVYLEGQAFFKIERNIHRPFIVHLSDFNIKVVGTSFDVKSYSNEAEIVISLKTGRIMIDGVGTNTLSIKAGQQFKFNKTTKTGEIREVNIADFIAWRSGQFRYESTELHLIAKAIERWFDVEISIENEDMWNYRLTINQSDSSLKEILDAISYVTGMKYDQNGKRIIFYKTEK